MVDVLGKKGEEEFWLKELDRLREEKQGKEGREVIGGGRKERGCR